MYKVNTRVKWMSDESINMLADELVTEFADGKANDQLAELIEQWAQGELIEGKQVYVKKLLGAMAGICPELVDAISSSHKDKPKQNRFRK